MFSSCTIHYQYTIGQSKSDFFRINKKHIRQLELVEATGERSAYKTKGNVNPLFFYFFNDVLIGVNRGKKSPNIIIENTK